MGNFQLAIPSKGDRNLCRKERGFSDARLSIRHSLKRRSQPKPLQTRCSQLFSEAFGKPTSKTDSKLPIDHFEFIDQLLRDRLRGKFSILAKAPRILPSLRFAKFKVRVNSSLLGGEDSNHHCGRPAPFCWEHTQLRGGQSPKPESKTIFQ